jgi:hypothetical protein
MGQLQPSTWGTQDLNFIRCKLFIISSSAATLDIHQCLSTGYLPLHGLWQATGSREGVLGDKHLLLCHHSAHFVSMASSAEARSPEAGASSEPAAGAPADQNGPAAAADASAEDPDVGAAPAGAGALLVAPKSPAPPRTEADLRAEFEALCSKQSAGRSVAWAHLEPVLLTDAASGTPKEVIMVNLIAVLTLHNVCCDCTLIASIIGLEQYALGLTLPVQDVSWVCFQE